MHFFCNIDKLQVIHVENRNVVTGVYIVVYIGVYIAVNDGEICHGMKYFQKEGSAELYFRIWKSCI